MLMSFVCRDKFGVPCWKCGRCVDDNKERYFCVCGVVQPPVTNRSLFDVMGVEETFDIDPQELSEKYRNLQRFLHPDKYSQKSDVCVLESLVSSYLERTICFIQFFKYALACAV